MIQNSPIRTLNPASAPVPTAPFSDVCNLLTHKFSERLNLPLTFSASAKGDMSSGKIFFKNEMNSEIPVLELSSFKGRILASYSSKHFRSENLSLLRKFLSEQQGYALASTQPLRAVTNVDVE